MVKNWGMEPKIKFPPISYAQSSMANFQYFMWLPTNQISKTLKFLLEIDRNLIVVFTPS